MTNKDYEAIARQFARTVADVEMEVEAPTTSHLDYVERLASRIANVLEKDNPRFDRERFIAACNV